MNLQRFRRSAKAVGAMLLLVLIAELLSRVILDFPLYETDATVGYWPKANQKGNFLLTHDWVFNQNSMGVANKYNNSTRYDVLLVGDSVVYGGNPFRQRDKLGPIIAHDTGWEVWPAAAGGWALQNELSFLERNASVVSHADAIVFVFNKGDFDEPASWTSESTHPRTYPHSYLWYALQKCCERPNADPPAELRVQKQDVFGRWLNFNRASKVPVIVIAYSAIAERNDGCRWVPRKFEAVGNWFCYTDSGPALAEDYRDPVHPSVKGNKRLAKFVISAVRSFVQKENVKDASERQMPH